MSESLRKHFIGCLHYDVRYEFKYIIQINMLFFLIEVAWNCWYSLWYVPFQYLYIISFILDFYVLPQTFFENCICLPILYGQVLVSEPETQPVWRPEDNVQESGLSCYMDLEGHQGWWPRFDLLDPHNRRDSYTQSK